MTKVKAEENIFAFRPENKAGWFERYKASIDFKGSISCSSSYDDYEKNRAKDVDSIKASEGVAIPLTERLKTVTSEEAKRAKAVIADKLKFDPTGRDQFNKDIADINNLMAAPKPKFQPGDIAQYLLIRKDEETKIIKAQHELTKNQLNEAFDNDAQFRADLKRSLNCSDADLNALKAEIIAARDKTHLEELSKFEKSIDENTNQFFNAMRDEFRRISYAAAALARDREVAREIEAMQQGETSTSMGGAGSDASLKKVDPKNLTKSESVAGDTVIKVGDSYTFTTSRFWESDDSIRTRVGSMVEQILAGGGDAPITIKISNKDPKEAARIADLVLEGAMVAGRADEKRITIIVNDEVKWKYNEKGEHEKNELFKNQPERLKYAREKRAALIGREEKFYKGTAEESGKRVKDELQALRKAQPVDEAEPQPGQQIQPI